MITIRGKAAQHVATPQYTAEWIEAEMYRLDKLIGEFGATVEMEMNEDYIHGGVPPEHEFSVTIRSQLAADMLEDYEDV